MICQKKANRICLVASCYWYLFQTTVFHRTTNTMILNTEIIKASSMEKGESKGTWAYIPNYLRRENIAKKIKGHPYAKRYNSHICTHRGLAVKYNIRKERLGVATSYGVRHCTPRRTLSVRFGKLISGLWRNDHTPGHPHEADKGWI